MHPALLPMLLVCCLPLAWRRTEHTRALAVVGLVVTLFLGPVLLRPDAIPSPSALLGRYVPWQGVLDPAQGNPHLVDVARQVEPWLLFLRDELRGGRLPFWNPFQFSGEPFWSNGSSAPLFPLHLLFAALPPLVGFTLLPWLRLVAGGVGAWMLARELGVSERAAWLAGVVYPLSGAVVSWALYPMGNAHLFVPWAFWALERFLRGRSSWRPLAVVAALQLLAGHPETPVFTGLLGVVYLLARGRGVAGSLRCWVGYGAAWAVGLAVSAIQVLPLAFTVFASSKIHEHGLPTPVPLTTKLAFLSRFLLPDLFGRAGEGTWWGPFNDPATAVYAGALVLPLAALAAVRVRHDPRWRATAVTGAFALAAAYHLFGLGFLLPRLPVIGLGLHHYMKFGAELALALLAAAGLDRLARAWSSSPAPGETPGRSSWVVVAGVVAWAGCLGWAFRTDWAERGLTACALGWLAWALAAACLVALLAHGASRRRGPAARFPTPVLVPILVVAASVDLAVAHHATAPPLPVERLYPATPGVTALRELVETGGRIAGVETAFRPNAGMVLRLPDVRGDSPLKLVHYDRVYGEIARPHPWAFQAIRDWDHPALDRLGVRWVMGAPGAAPPRSGWRTVYRGPDATLWERPGGLPLVRWSSLAGERAKRVVERRPGAWTVEVGPGAAAELVVAETWDPGWRARWNGEPVAVGRKDGLLLSVLVPRDAGRLRLVYRPYGIASGTVLSVLGVLALLPWTAIRRRGLFPHPPSDDKVTRPENDDDAS